MRSQDLETHPFLTLCFQEGLAFAGRGLSRGVLRRGGGEGLFTHCQALRSSSTWPCPVRGRAQASGDTDPTFGRHLGQPLRHSRKPWGPQMAPVPRGVFMRKGDMAG